VDGHMPALWHAKSDSSHACVHFSLFHLGNLAYGKMFGSQEDYLSEACQQPSTDDRRSIAK
jgi:hypothetical protein